MFLAQFNLLQRADAVDKSHARQDNLQTRKIHWAFEMEDNQFIKRYRLSKALVHNLAIELSQSDHITETGRDDGLDPITKILTALSFYACGAYQTQIGDMKMHCMTQASVSKSVKQVTLALNEIGSSYIKFPSRAEEMHLTQNNFYQSSGIPGVLGCIDGTHVAIISPILHEERYVNRKGYHSLNVLLICDSNLQITCVDPSYPGSTHDSTIWNNHPVKLFIDNFYEQSTTDYIYLLGDSGYPLRKTMMTPILNADPETPEANYIKMQISARSKVERCIGVLKGRFRCLLAARALHYAPEMAAKIINATCVLHNIANFHNIWFEPLSHEEMQEESRLTRSASPRNVPNIGNNIDLQLGRQVRNALVQRLWQF